METGAPDHESDEPLESLAEFFDRIEREGGMSLDDEDHRLIVGTIRMDREHGH
jgi:transposase